MAPLLRAKGAGMGFGGVLAETEKREGEGADQNPITQSVMELPFRYAQLEYYQVW